LQEVTIILQDIADKMPLYFNMPVNYTLDDVGAISAIIRTSGKR
jgi:hypothetical protein